MLDPARHRFASLPTPDDVVVTGDGHIFVTSLGDNRIHELDAQGHPVAVLAGIPQPQGLALDAADNLYYTAFNSGQIARVVRTYVLGTPAVQRLATGTYLICPVVRRATGYQASLSLTTASNPGISIIREVQPGENSSGALEVRTSARSITISIGALSQTIALAP